MWKLLIKQEILNMRSLTNKTEIIKYKNLSVYLTVYKSDWVTYPKQQKLFFKKSWRNELMAFSLRIVTTCLEIAKSQVGRIV